MSAIQNTVPSQVLLQPNDQEEQSLLSVTASIANHVVEKTQPFFGANAIPKRTWDPLIDSINDVIIQKKANVQRALQNKWVRYHPGMIGGDALTMAYTGFTGVQYFLPALQTVSWVGWVTSSVGEIGGLINIWVACQEFREAYTAIQNKDMVNAWKMIFDASFFVLIGLLMIVVGITTKVFALGSVSAFFTANPWLLPVLFFIVTIPLILEIGYRVKIIVFKQDLASQIPFQAITTALEQNNHEQVLQLIEHSPFASLLVDQSKLTISDKMEELQADMGVEAAIEVFSLFKALLDDSETEEIQRQLQLAQQRIAEWHHAQYVRLFQQVLYIAAFIISMGAFAPGANANVINGSDNMAMAAANLIPLGMDVCWPFKRNVPMIVPKVDVEKAK